MEQYSFFPRRYSRIFWMAVVVLSFCLMAISATHEHSNSFACYGLIGKGHPFDFLCDYSDGAIPLLGSVSDSVGKIDIADVPYFSAQGVIMDFLIYCAILLAIWFIVTYSIHQVRHRGGNRGIHH